MLVQVTVLRIVGGRVMEIEATVQNGHWSVPQDLAFQHLLQVHATHAALPPSYYPDRDSALAQLVAERYAGRFDAAPLTEGAGDRVY